MSLLTATREEQLHRVAAVPMVFPVTPVPPPAVGNAEPQVLRQRQQPETGQAHQNGSNRKFWQRQSNSGGINRSNGADLPSSSGDAGGFRGDDTSHNKDGGSETPTATSFPATEQAELATTRRHGDGDPGGDGLPCRALPLTAVQTPVSLSLRARRQRQDGGDSARMSSSGSVTDARLRLQGQDGGRP
ncbi:uncharacterized protein DS421_11g330040 [Arachis hypogaea]|nr:uncharacterized protein DS421_11g330040 [Arachis hypogaea]